MDAGQHRRVRWRSQEGDIIQRERRGLDCTSSSCSNRSKARELDNAHRITAAFGVDNVETNLVLQSLRKIPAKRIVYETYNLDYPIPDYITMSFQPIIENAAFASPQETFLSECPVTLFMTGNFKKCEKILGYTANEILSFTESKRERYRVRLPIRNMPITRQYYTSYLARRIT